MNFSSVQNKLTDLSQSHSDPPSNTLQPSEFTLDLSRALANIRDEVNQLKVHVSSRVIREVQSSETSRTSVHNEVFTRRTSVADSDPNPPSSSRTFGAEKNGNSASADFTKHSVNQSMLSELSEKEMALNDQDELAYQEFETEYKKSESFITSANHHEKSSAISIDCADGRQTSTVSSIEESLEEAGSVTDFNEGITISVYDAQWMLEGRPCVIHSQKNDIRKFKKDDRYAVESYESEVRVHTRESPISKSVQIDSNKSAKQLRDLNEFKNSMQHIMKIVKSGESIKIDENVVFPTRKRQYKELTRAYDADSRRERSNPGYEYEDMYYEGANADIVQQTLSIIFSTNESKYDSIPVSTGLDCLHESFQANSKRSVLEHPFLQQEQCVSAGSERRSLQQSEQEIDSNSSRKKEVQEFRTDEYNQHSFRAKTYTCNIDRSESTAISYSGTTTPQPLSNHPTERKHGSDENKLLDVIRDLEEKNKALQQNFELVVQTLQVCTKEIDTLAHHNKRMIGNLKKYESEIAKRNVKEKELTDKYEAKVNEVEYLKRELQAKERKAGEHIIVNTELTRKVKTMTEYLLASDKSFKSIHKALRQLSKCTDKRSLAAYLGEILNETAKFVRSKEPSREMGDLEDSHSESGNSNVLRESNRTESFRPSKEAGERKTSPLLNKNSSEIYSPNEINFQPHFGTKSVTQLTTKETKSRNDSDACTTRSRESRDSASDASEKGRRSRSRSHSAKRNNENDNRRDSNRKRSSKKRRSRSAEKSPSQGTLSTASIKKIFNLDDNLEENLRKQLLCNIKK